MAHSSASQSFIALARSVKRPHVTDSLTQCLAPRLSRSFASHTDFPTTETQDARSKTITSNTAPTQTPTANAYSHSQVLTTLYNWPSMEPTRYALYSHKHLDMPLRRDLLHRAVVYEGNASRQGTASTKWRSEVRGSGRKIRPQKGTGHARLGDKKSPMLRGGGVAFGPKPRDYATDLPRKVYDIAWRTALSYRYRKGELIVLDGDVTMPEEAGPRLLAEIFEQNRWGQGNQRSLVVTAEIDEMLYENMSQVDEHAMIKDVEDVDVKDLLETGRVIIEKRALDIILATHSHDLGVRLSLEEAMMAENAEYHENVARYV